MSTEIDWSKAPDDATHCYEIVPEFFKKEGEMWMVWFSNARRWAVAEIPARLANLLDRPLSQGWTGKGLPPVGVACEYMRGDVPHISQDWEEVIPLAFGRKLALLRHAATENEFTEKVYRCAFRPIRTQAQIEEE
jgi:hypothetical protein